MDVCQFGTLVLALQQMVLEMLDLRMVDVAGYAAVLREVSR